VATARPETEADGAADPVSRRFAASLAVERSAGAGVGDGATLNAAPGDADADVGAPTFC
jgi:hypothetical protein